VEPDLVPIEFVCRRRDLNPYNPFGSGDFKSPVSANSTTPAQGRVPYFIQPAEFVKYPPPASRGALAFAATTIQTPVMATKIIIEAEKCRLEAELSDASAAQKIAEALPLSASMSRWGDEYYGSVGIDIPENATGREIMKAGELAYWPPGKALCIFFGPTPASTDEKPRAASAVLPVGQVTAGAECLKGLGARVKMSFKKA
jgi:hypothetical protein